MRGSKEREEKKGEQRNEKGEVARRGNEARKDERKKG